MLDENAEDLSMSHQRAAADQYIILVCDYICNMLEGV